MKRGRDDEKVMGPLFPRLHVNDTEKKGGPRAPPRNKMALYEQLSVPSQRFGSGIVPIKSNSSTNLVPAGSSSQRSILERNVRFPSHVPPHMPNQLAEMLHSCRHDGGNMNTSLLQLKQRKKVHDEDDFRVPVFVHSGTGQNNAKTQSDIDEKIIPFHTTHSGSSMNDVSTTSLHLRQDLMNQSDENLEARVLDGDHTTFISFPSRGKIARIEEVVNASPKQCDGDHSAVNESNTCLQQEPTNDKCSDGGIPKLKRRREKGNAWLQRSDFCSGEVHSSPNEPEIDSECQVDKTCGSVQVGNGDKSNDASETSMVDSVSALAISPDEVVGIIGQKHFWKARKAIVNQQRVFAIQVFELHRLIKVQQLIAGSPHLLLEDNNYPEKPSAKGSTPNNVPSDCVVNAPTHAANRKDDSEKSNHRMECSAENAVGKTSLSLVKNGSPPPSYGPYLGNPIPVPTASDPKMGPWYFHQSFGQQQWLVPVMSPSEGLIYKPYTPPGFGGSVFGGCGPFGPPLFACNFVNPAYGVPAPHPHQGIGVPPGAPPVGHGYYLPSYGMPVMSPSISGSAVEQMNHFAGSASHSQLGQASGDGVKFNTQQQSSHNALTQKGGPIPQSKDTELQGSTGSSPCETAKGVGMVQDADRRDPLPVHPMVPTPPGGNPQFQETDHPTRVIRVVPHNPRSATESAVRIFQSIQAEKRQLDSL